MCKSQLDQNLWHKSQMFLASMFFNFGRQKDENLSFKNGHFSTICGHFYGNFMDIFHKTEIQMVILRCLVCLNLNWIKSYDIIIGYFFFHALKCIISRVKYQSKFWHLRRKLAAIFSKCFFFNSLVSHGPVKSGKMQGKKEKWFLNFLLNKKSNSNLSFF